MKTFVSQMCYFFSSLFSFRVITLFKVADIDENDNLIIFGSPVNFPVMENKLSDSCCYRAFKPSTTKKKKKGKVFSCLNNFCGDGC